MFVAPMLTIIWQDVVAIETIKILVGLSIGAILIFFRNLIIQILATMVKSIIKTPKAIIDGIKLIGSEKFQAMPHKVEQLQEKLDSIDKKVRDLEHTVGPNGGKSLLDGVNELKKLFSSLEHNIRAIVYNAQQIVDASETMMFSLSSTGNFTWASKGLQDLVDFSFDDGFKNQQWENLYFPEDLLDVRRRWADAIKTSIEIDNSDSKLLEPEVILTLLTRFRHNNTNEEIPVKVRLTKMPDGSISGIVNKISKTK